MSSLRGRPDQDSLKELVGRVIADSLSDGDCIGIGSGTTVMATVEQIGERIRTDGISILAVVSSYEVESACLRAGIRVVVPPRGQLAWSFDGADEVDPKLDYLKGRGGALFREAIVDAMARRLVLVVDETKLVAQLGTRFPVTVEVAPEARYLAGRELDDLGATEVTLRMSVGKDGPVVTEHGNLLLDCKFGEIRIGLGNQIRLLPGVVEAGLFQDRPVEALVAKSDGVWRATRHADAVEWSLERPAVAGATR